jgi:predicted nicotinamide N-methyase
VDLFQEIMAITFSRWRSILPVLLLRRSHAFVPQRAFSKHHDGQKLGLRASTSSKLETLIQEKIKAVDDEDYLRAAELKQEIDAIQQQQQQSQDGSSLMLNQDGAILLHRGDYRFPPMSELPCTLKGTSLQKMVKPPDADTLWQWYEEMGNLEADPSWAEVWPSAASLAAALVSKEALLKNCRVFELGSGLGIAGLTAASLGASSVVLMDREPFALHCAMASAALNQLANVQAAVVDWSSPQFQDDYGQSADIVLCSDVLYDADTVVALANLVASLMRPGGRVWVTDPSRERVAGVRDKFVQALEAQGATVSVTALPPAPVYHSCYTETSQPEQTVFIEALWKKEP